MKRLPVITVIILLCLGAIQAQSNSAGESYYRMLSPVLLGGGLDLTSSETPQLVGVNPASAGFYQRYILDMNYINLSSLDNGYQGMGHAVNMALAMPSAYGVVTTAFHYQDWDAQSPTILNFGRFVSGDVAFSKELYDDLYFGLALNGAYQLSGSADWGASLSTGVIYQPGDLGKLKNVSLAANLSHLGKTLGISDRGTLGGVPEMITPMVGISFDALSREAAVVRMFSTVSAPSLTDVKLDLGASLRMGDALTLKTSVSADVLDIAEGHYDTVIPAVLLNVNLPLTPKGEIMDKLNTSELNIQGAGGMLYDSTLAVGGGVTIPFGVRDSNPPQLTMEYPEKQYISPNYDGTKDELELPLMVDEERYIQGYIISIYNEEGQVVRQYFNKDERPENSTFNSLFQRLKTPRQSVPMPESFRWDGMTEEGEIAPDGEYTFDMEIWDDNLNRFTSEPQSFTIDATKPELEIQRPLGADLIFSPDGDGNKDAFTLPQSGSPEDSWTGEIRDASGNTVKTFKWEEGAPTAMTWDGTDEEGEILPDGVYQYVAFTEDRAGNREEESVNNILINTAQPEIRLSLDHAFLAPGNANARDRIFLGLNLSTVNGLSQWTLEIVDEQGRVYRSWNDRAHEDIIRTGSLEYNGAADQGGFLNEGRYKARFSPRYQNGFAPVVFSPEFKVDTTAPEVKLSVSPRTFSPDGDGRQDEVIFKQTTSEEENWRGVLMDETGNIVQEYQWRGRAPEEFRWNGRDRDGKIRSVTAPLEYSYYLEASDQAGNFTRSETGTFFFDNSQVEFLLSVDQEAFSPNGDGVKDRLNVSMQQIGEAPVASHRLYLIDERGREVEEISTGSAPPATLAWDGGDAEDGTYQVRIDLEYTRGSRLTMTSSNFIIDRVFPEIQISNSPLLISPNGDGRRDSLDITQSSSTEELFEAQLTDLNGQVLNTWFWKGQLADLSWGGVDETGNILPNGQYRYLVSSQDIAGNRTEKRVENIQIDNRRSDVFLTASKEIFSPEGRDGYKQQEISMITTLKEGIESWELNLVHSESGQVKHWEGSSVPPEKFTWDGVNDKGEVLQGEYTAQAVVHYHKGDQPQAESTPFILDNSAPVVNLKLEPVPFSPDADNVDDELVLSMAVRDLSPIEGWRMDIFDPRDKEFISFSGQGRPTQRIIWDGRSNRGELVQSAEDYRYQLTVTDVMGNSTTEEGLIPVDVLVVRDGDRLKILISNITFEPERPTLTNDEKNMEVLSRIAEILEKYSRYRVVVEGHANPILGTQAEKAVLATLSEQRAQKVVEILVDLGVEEDRLGAIGKGGNAILAEPTNRDENWRNRRVEFILEK